jgi:hypothetical protein
MARGFWRASGGATAVEFALALPVLLALTLGALECGLMVFEIHRAGEAIRILARDFEIDPPLMSFAHLPATCPDDGDCDDGRIDEAVQSVHALLPNFAKSNLRIEYRASGLDNDTVTPGIVTPTLTVSLVGRQYRFLVLRSVVPGLADAMTLPPLSTTRVVSSRLR